MAMSFTITISDALGLKLRDKYGSLDAIRASITAKLKAEIVADDLAVFKRDRIAVVQAAVQTEIDNEQSRLNTLY